MTSEVFNSSGSMGAMPKRVTTQADYFWGQGNATAIPPTTLPTVTTGPDPQIGTTSAQGAATETASAVTRLVNWLRRFRMIDPGVNLMRRATMLHFPSFIRTMTPLYHNLIPAEYNTLLSTNKY
ncbi:hypothetical protein P692DRAFT_20821095 [Suillus brevipes Sb2]|nr:hypothetical protein P692DRAFT_20821095 [Suillus brevipes Sb2]